jgi:hypothetical protein
MAAPTSPTTPIRLINAAGGVTPDDRGFNFEAGSIVHWPTGEVENMLDRGVCETVTAAEIETAKARGVRVSYHPAHRPRK